MQTGAAWLGAKLKTHAGRSVTITRNATVSSAITATSSMQEYAIIDEDGIATSVTSYDWTFLTDDLPWELRVGDLIKETLDGASITYEVLPVAAKPAVEWVDTSGVLTVAHCKRIVN